LIRLSLARAAARGVRVLPWRARVRLVLAAMRLLARRSVRADGACECTACGARLDAFVPDYGQAPAARLLGIAGTSVNPRLYGGAARKSCPVCLEPERTRFLLWALAREDFRAARRRVLVCSGGPGLLRHMAAHDTVSANLRRTLFADTACDLRQAPFADASFDAVICAYVLSYIDDDAAALREVFRMLRPRGVAWLVVPQDLSLATVEEGSDLAAAERAEKFGNACHMRLYGMDFSAVLGGIGFSVSELVPRALLPAGEIARLGLQPEDRLYRCTKP
jgi:SAM-dependent methyltransferase